MNDSTTVPPRRHTGGSRSNAEMLKVQPLLSIVVVVFRDRDELRQIIESVLPHKNHDLELIVIDGASDDGTVELLQAYNARIDYWLSEPDRGIYDAMNKGLEAASGEYILHLNAGDRLLTVPWETLRQHAKDKIDVVCCTTLIDSNLEFKSFTGFLSRFDNTWHHQGIFYRRAAHLGYDASYHTCGDFDHNQRLLKTGCTIQYDPSIIADHQSGGASMAAAARREIYRSVQANFGWRYLMLARLRFALMNVRGWIRMRFPKPVHPTS